MYKQMTTLDQTSLALSVASSKWTSNMSSSSPKNENILQAGPSEIAVEILKWLSCQDLLSVRKTCRFLDDVSRMRSLWVNLVSTQGTFLEEPLDSYTAEQLRFHVCKQLSAMIQWRSDNPEPAQVKEVNIPPNDHMVLIRGGRWLLVGFGTGEVVAHDLDSTDARKMTIIEAGLPISKLVVDMDDSAPFLKFKLAILSNSSSAPGLQIYQVSLLGHDDQAELAATRIISIPIDVRGRIIFASLRGEYFCRGTSVPRPSYYHCVEVFKWRNCTKPGSYPVSTIYLRVQNRLVSGEILPGNQILLLQEHIMQGSNIAIFDLPEPRAEVLGVFHRTPRWKLPIEGRWGQKHNVRISTPQWGHSSSYTTYTTIDGIYGVTVPLDPCENPEVVKLLDFTVEKGSSFAIGLEKTFIWGAFKGLFTGNYSFEKPYPSVGFNPVARLQEFKWLETRVRIVMDEQTGRVVIGLEGQDYVQVLDFAREIKKSFPDKPQLAV